MTPKTDFRLLNIPGNILKLMDDKYVIIIIMKPTMCDMVDRLLLPILICNNIICNVSIIKLNKLVSKNKNKFYYEIITSYYFLT